jgi:hypothetical protein
LIYNTTHAHSITHLGESRIGERMMDKTVILDMVSEAEISGISIKNTTIGKLICYCSKEIQSKFMFGKKHSRITWKLNGKVTSKNKLMLLLND